MLRFKHVRETYKHTYKCVVFFYDFMVLIHLSLASHERDPQNVASDQGLHCLH